MATIAIGDIHGNCRALDDLLKQIEPELTDDDTVVFLGDYIDRGPDSRGCIDAILRLRDERLCPVVALKGNHGGTRARARQRRAPVRRVLRRAQDAQAPKTLVWGASAFLTAYGGPETVVYGHWNNARLDEAGWPHPAIARFTVGLDTSHHGVVTAFRWPVRRVFQSSRFSVYDEATTW